MKAPLFWQKKNILSFLFAPLSWLYQFISQRRIKKTKPYTSTLPVICVGNITAGGTGKTPLALFLAEHLRHKGKKVHFLTRGYKGKLDGVKVNLEKHNASDVGDEALLLAKKAPTWVFSNRAKGAQTIEKTNADLIIMDDGFQNPTLKKTISFVVFDGKDGIGNGKVIPSGPLREPFSKGLKRANAVIITGDDLTHLAKKLPANLPCLKPKSSRILKKQQN